MNSVIRLPWRQHAETYTDPQPTLAPYERPHVDFEDKPADMVRAAQPTEWTREDRYRERLKQLGYSAEPPRQPDVIEPPTVAMDKSAPKREGVYWYSESGNSDVRLGVVLRFGGRLCIRYRSGDASTWISVEALNRRWSSSPIPTPEGMSLEAFS